jgi:hypothetical protein
VVHPSVGLRLPTSSSSLSVFNLLTFICSCAQSHKSNSTEDKRSTHSAPDPPSQNWVKAQSQLLTSTEPYFTQSVCTKQLSTSCTKPTYYAHSQSILINLLLTLLSYLFIHLQKGLNMGKPMGRHPITCYINPKTLCWVHKPTKQVRSRDLSSSWALHLRPACRSPKSGQTRPMFPQNLVKGQHHLSATASSIPPAWS